MIRSKRHLLFPLLLAAAGAHAAPLTYTCADGQRLSLSFDETADGRPQATVHRAAGDLVLPRVIAASGTRYYAAPVELRTQGDEAFYDGGGGRVLHCARGVATAVAADATPATSDSFLTLTGSVGYRSRNALPPTAILHIRVEDAAGKPARVLAEQRYELAGTQAPIPFVATIDRDLIGQHARIQVTARIEIGGKTRYVNDRAYPAVKDGQALPLAIQLKPLAAPKR